MHPRVHPYFLPHTLLCVILRKMSALNFTLSFAPVPGDSLSAHPYTPTLSGRPIRYPARAQPTANRRPPAAALRLPAHAHEPCSPAAPLPGRRPAPARRPSPAGVRRLRAAPHRPTPGALAPPLPGRRLAPERGPSPADAQRPRAASPRPEPCYPAGARAPPLPRPDPASTWCGRSGSITR